jgi:hypothetical protein
MRKHSVLSRVAVPLLALCTLTASAGAKQDKKAATDSAKKGATEVATKLLPVPASPAFSYLGASASKVQRPATPRDFGAQLVNGIGIDGRVKQGFAVEVAPYLYLPDVSISLTRYQASFLSRILANTQLSIASVKSAGDTASTDLAIGLRVPLIDDSDPMQNIDLTSAMAAGMLKCAPNSPQPNTEEVARASKCLTEAVTAAAKAAVPSTWNVRRLTLAAAAGMRFDSSSVQNGRGTGHRAWLSYSDGFRSWGQWIISGMYQYDQRDTSDSTFNAGNTGFRVNIGSDRFNAFAEGTAEWRFNAPRTVDSFTRNWSFGVEFRAMENTWVSTGIGTLYEGAGKPDRTALILGLNWGVASVKRLNPTE